MGVYCAGELIKRYREAQRLTQEQLSEGICSVETLSRFENGHQTPGRHIYQQLMGRLGKNTERAYAVVCGRNIKISDLIAEYQACRWRLEYEEADTIIKKLESLVDDSTTSRQYVLAQSAALDMHLLRISPQEARKQLLEVLKLTISEPERQDFNRYPLMANELSILYHIANTYLAEDQFDAGIKLLEAVLQGIKSGYRGTEVYHYKEIMIMERLAHMYGRMGDYHKAIALAEQALSLCRQQKCSVRLPQLLQTMAWSMEQLLQQEEKTLDFTWKDCKKVLRQAYCLASALGQKRYTEILKNRYLESFGEELSVV